ncbi:hypothetical protein HRR83_003456 [Exophiala dermatitidis]|uniref:MYND-type domain-containing protein n=2 Tax=Exophiala dermatitidis TaxID=5970 RepID=H6BM45_EXODN|nr:uncharacterized protein HMPREF1120_00204 [Exophiala dermatitidis NIH/UT8656]KAJ4518087.1 hypothetical protein HRR74_004382 [Exophiala dermatitidis]EHY51981.1 hypothetical protein HMPREF1120_00204 [Exophiala dermatitidis NIH/UT8656]KAJ4520986.1 hypothetical protein HRR73_003327 [Exophiala dermatitidis]KAJ4547566.1 hypothetical protein HRR76_000200 [Exophiala dermatitidis]KAJ4553506.1 hypothetical protein HRR77_001892 [Exophiala dermatitidis]
MPPSPAATNFKGPRGPLKHRCGLCQVPGPKAKLSLCTGCRVVRYCSREHQVQHRPEHKSVCNKIKRYRTKVAKEEDAVRNATEDFMTPANAFETHVGHFWGILNTRDYMRARFELADTVRLAGTLDGVTEALEHMRDMLRLCRKDNVGVRHIIPPVMLQLDQDQECYDFIKWYETEGQRGDYDWGNMDLPFLNIKGADILEDVEYLRGKYADVHNVSAVMLLKLKLLVDIINIKLARKVISARLPPETWEGVELRVIRSPLSRQWVGKSDQLLTSVQQKLEIHVKLLARTLQTLNEHFVSTLLEADEWLSESPYTYSRGSFEEMLLLLQYSYAAWWQHEGVLELLQSAKAIAAKDSEVEIESMMKSTTFKTNPGSNRTKAELLDDVSRNRLWGYFSDAVEDATSLNETPPSEVKILSYLGDSDYDISDESD